MYQTLYRKYRPNTFNEVVGQDIIIKTLKNEINNNHLNHAYLFTGPRGTGKTSIAKILAKTINCDNLVDCIPCDKCVNCTQINNKKNTDIIEIDAASNNGVDEIRELKSKVNLVPSTGKYKVYIIDEVHMLTIGAFNALLKTLEEPPSHIIFILATTDPHKIPTTILSRCQRFDFKKISINNLVNRLKKVTVKEQIDIEDKAILEIARLADGGMRDALSILDQVVAFSENKITIKDVHEVNGTLSKEKMIVLLKNIIESKLAEELNQLDELNDNGKNLVKLTEEFIVLLRDILLYKTAPTYFGENYINIEILKDISQEINEDELIYMIKKFNDTLNQMRNSNNPKLLLELLIIELSKPSTSKLKNKAIKDNSTNTKSEKVSEKNVDNVLEKEQEKNKHEKIEIPKIDSIKKNNFDKKEMQQFIDIRINNALSGFNKRELISIKEKLKDLTSLLIDPNCSKYISMILDAELKIAGNNYLVYVYPNKKLVDIFNANLIELEKIIENQIGIKYRLISIDDEKWQIVKNEYNSKIKKYELKKETITLETLFPKTKKNDEMKNLFGDLVEYKEEE